MAKNHRFQTVISARIDEVQVLGHLLASALHQHAIGTRQMLHSKLQKDILWAYGSCL